ncbi:ORF017 [Staphylococcus phage 96]|uniref:ORF017 n=1 Tax=Staphylococcus phage 96 TaxID=2936815 RepID=Q4ZBY1_9CAUD|nr:ORF017 [Staphylococcus phage 96]
MCLSIEVLTGFTILSVKVEDSSLLKALPKSVAITFACDTAKPLPKLLPPPCPLTNEVTESQADEIASPTALTTLCAALATPSATLPINSAPAFKKSLKKLLILPSASLIPSPTFETTLLNPSATLLAKLVTVFQMLETHSEPFVIIKFSACPIFSATLEATRLNQLVTVFQILLTKLVIVLHICDQLVPNIESVRFITPVKKPIIDSQTDCMYCQIVSSTLVTVVLIVSQAPEKSPVSN